MKPKHLSIRIPAEIWREIEATKPRHCPCVSQWINQLLDSQLSFINKRGNSYQAANLARRPQQTQQPQPEAFQDETISYDPEFMQ